MKRNTISYSSPLTLTENYYWALVHSMFSCYVSCSPLVFFMYIKSCSTVTVVAVAMALNKLDAATNCVTNGEYLSFPPLPTSFYGCMPSTTCHFCHHSSKLTRRLRVEIAISTRCLCKLARLRAQWVYKV